MFLIVYSFFNFIIVDLYARFKRGRLLIYVLGWMQRNEYD